MRWLDPDNGPAGDLAPPPPGHPRHDWLLASSPRTGSTWLGRLLSAAGDVGQPKEWLNGMQVRDLQARLAPSPASRWVASRLGARAAPLLLWAPWTDAALAGYLDRVRRVRTSPSGWFAIKLHAHHRRHWFEAAGRRLDGALAPALVVRLRRRDALAQAVSWARAAQSGAWASHQRAYAAPRYDGRRIAACLHAIARDDADWTAWLDARPALPRMYIDYEDVVTDPLAAVAHVRAALGVGPWNGPLPDVGMARQADGVSLAWQARFRAEFGGGTGRPTGANG